MECCRRRMELKRASEASPLERFELESETISETIWRKVAECMREDAGAGGVIVPRGNYQSINTTEEGWVRYISA